MTIARFVICTGDFNTKIGQRSKDYPENIGNFGLGKRNTKGEMLLNFLAQRTYTASTLFYKNNQRDPPHLEKFG